MNNSVVLGGMKVVGEMILTWFFIQVIITAWYWLGCNRFEFLRTFTGYNIGLMTLKTFFDVFQTFLGLKNKFKIFNVFQKFKKIIPIKFKS